MSLLLLSLLACTDSPSVATDRDAASNPVTDPSVTVQSWYPDADRDGFGDAFAVPTVASGISGGTVAYVLDATDCDDASASVHPGVPEICDDMDNNCDGAVDNAAADQPFWFLDLDNDGFGDSTVMVQSCDGLSHFVNDGTDCDDVVNTVFPGAPESCNDVDDDCDGSVDEDPATGTTYYMDADGDGSGSGAEDAETIVACERPGLEWIPGHTDCDDADPDINSGADEYCDGVDNDCDGEVDNHAVDATTWYGDGDGDGFGDMNGWYIMPVRSCDQPAGYIADGSDCEDGLEWVHPGAEESCDWWDNDCDGFIDNDDPDGVSNTSYWYADRDGDSFGDSTTGVETCEYNAWMSSMGWNVVVDSSDCDDADIELPGTDPDRDGFDLCEGDCDDYNWRANPAATEVDDDFDDDCDGEVDEAG